MWWEYTAWNVKNIDFTNKHWSQIVQQRWMQSSLWAFTEFNGLETKTKKNHNSLENREREKYWVNNLKRVKIWQNKIHW